MNAQNTHQTGPDTAVNIRRSRKSPGEQRDRLITLLDRAIVLLMAAIVLTLAWPVGMALWGQSRAAQAGVVCLNDSAPPQPACGVKNST